MLVAWDDFSFMYHSMYNITYVVCWWKNYLGVYYLEVRDKKYIEKRT